MNMQSRFALLAVLLVLVGCVSTPIDEIEHQPVLMITQNSDGVVSISWDSVVGYTYKLYTIDRGQAEWKPLNKTFKGTGETLFLTDKVRPGNTDRRYWIQADKIPGYQPEK